MAIVAIVTSWWQDLKRIKRGGPPSADETQKVGSSWVRNCSARKKKLSIVPA